MAFCEARPLSPSSGCGSWPGRTALCAHAVLAFLAGLGGPWRGMWWRCWARDCWSASERRQGRSMTSRGGASGGGSGLGVSTPLAADALDAYALDADATPGQGSKASKAVFSQSIARIDGFHGGSSRLRCSGCRCYPATGINPASTASNPSFSTEKTARIVII